MKERPILFTPEMIRAIGDDRKTQTRRVIKPQPLSIGWFEHQNEWCAKVSEFRHELRPCPYGKPGDRLWVKERFEFFLSCFTDDGRIVFSDGALRDVGPLSGAIPDKSLVGYFRWVDRCQKAKKAISISARYMPRWASRLMLEIVSVRVERVKAISRQDAAAEGICYLSDIDFKGKHDGLYIVQKHHWPEENFSRLWDSINGKSYPWDSDPWVWVIEFERVNA